MNKIDHLNRKIEFVILRKFPLYKVVKYGEKQPPGSMPNRVVDRGLRKEILGYEKEILSLNRPSFEKLYSQILEEKNQEREESYFFNQPDAQADFDYWARLSSWKVEEAVALSFGKNPKVVTFKKITQDDVKHSSLSHEYVCIHDIIIRAVDDGVLNKKLKPSVFLAWAKGLKILVPDGLIEAVNKFNKPSPPESKEGSTHLQVPELQRQDEFREILVECINDFYKRNSYLPNIEDVIRKLKKAPPEGELVEFTGDGFKINNHKNISLKDTKKRIKVLLVKFEEQKSS